MVFARAVASPATNASFEKRRRGETVLRAGDGLKPAGVTYEASSPHGPREVDERVLLVARRNIPLARKRIIRNRSLKQESIQRKKVTSAHPSGSHEPSQQSAALDARILAGELHRVSGRFRRN